MARFLLRRLALLVAVLFAVTFLGFSAMNLLGDPLLNVVGVLAELDCEGIEAGTVQDTTVDVASNDCETVAAARAEYHLDRPVPVRYVLWLRDMATGDFGTSFQNDQPVRQVIVEKLPETLILLVMAQIVSLGVAIPWGVIAAYRANRAFDRGSTVASFGLLSIPNFALGVVLLYLLALRWQIFPSAYESDTVGGLVFSMVLPALTLGLPLAASYQRLLRTDLITTLQEDFVHMARAKGPAAAADHVPARPAALDVLGCDRLRRQHRVPDRWGAGGGADLRHTGDRQGDCDRGGPRRLPGGAVDRDAGRMHLCGHQLRGRPVLHLARSEGEGPMSAEGRPSRKGRASRQRLLQRFRILRMMRSGRTPETGGESDDAAVRRRLGVGFWLAMLWLVVMAFVALFAPLLPIADPTEVGFGGARESPSFDAWFGTDALGRDVFSRTMHGARISLAVGGFAIVFGMVVGGALGILAGYFRGRLDQAVGFVFFVLLSFPALVLAILITAALERSLLVVSLTIGILAVAPVGLLSRASTLVYAEREFVSAARVLGAKHGRIIVRELLPNVVIPMGALTLLGMALAVVAEGSLAFLGLSVAGDDAISWGKMIVDGAGIRDLQNSVHVAMLPVVVMFVTVLALNFAGDRIRQYFDVKELAF